MWKTASLIARTFARDFKATCKYGKYLAYFRYATLRKKTVPMVFQDMARRNGKKTMFIFGDKKWTFEEAEEYTNKIANYFSARGLKAGDDVALMMENRPELVLMWLGLSKIGVSTALINTNLRGDPLYHCTEMVNSKAVIFSPQMSPQIKEIEDRIENNPGVKLFRFGDNCVSERGDKAVGYDIQQEIIGSSSNAPTFKGDLSDTILYIYTSGTTGLPKAAKLRHSRYFLTSSAARNLANISSDDVSYCYLPMYHFAAGVMQLSQTVLHSCTALIVPGFSATNFWADCIKYNCTTTQYIGEVCRYLYLQPPKPEDRNHKIHTFVGNGLREQLWDDFQKRFGIPNIRELYGATESNGNLMNFDDKAGAVGIYPTFCRFSKTLSLIIYNRAILRVDPETGKPLRGPDGLCIFVGPNEPGEYVAAITKKPESQFDGYTDSKANASKIYTDVLQKGDSYFASGDILLYNDDGYIFFKDRTGDTFRWKGENVSTTEVEAVISKNSNHVDAVVIGVEVPNCEGKAGMAIILDPEKKMDLKVLLEKISRDLPAYALPLFVRLTDHLPTTGTFKLQKNDLVKEAYDISIIKDPIYFLNAKSKEYVLLTPELHKEIASGRIRI